MRPPGTESAHERRFALSLIIFILALLAFIWLAEQVARGAGFGFDGAIRSFFHLHASPPLTAFMTFVTRAGEPTSFYILGAALFTVLLAKGEKRAAVLLALAICGGGLLDVTLKLSFARARPEPFFGYAQPESYSFPSGHAMISTCFLGTVAALGSRRLRSAGAKAALWAAALFLVLVIGLSRIYLGVHYPSDVAAGYAAAAIWLSAVASVDHYRARRSHSGDPRC